MAELHGAHARDAKVDDVEAQLEATQEPTQIGSIDEKESSDSHTASLDVEEKPSTAVAVPANVSSDSPRDPAFLVTFRGTDDPADPKNWSNLFRWYLVCLVSMVGMTSSFASSAPSGIIRELGGKFHFSEEVGSLTISIFLAGYLLGPLLWAPASEVYGRRPTFVASTIGFVGFTVGCALSQNTAQILVFRFLAGAFGACPLSNAPAVIGDICGPKQRATAVGIFVMAPLAGPAFAPMCSGFISVSGTSWRWIFWVITIWGGVNAIAVLLTLPETYAPSILVREAAKKRDETGDERWYGQLEAVKIPPGARVQSIVVKPWAIFVREPILICIHVYMAFQYGVLYLMFEAYPIIFGVEKGWNAGVAAIPFLGIGIGGALGVLLVVIVFTPRYIKKMQSSSTPIPPEHHLVPAQIGSVAFMVAFFIIGWSSYPGVSWVGPTLGGGLQAFGVTLNFLTLTAFIIEVYLQVAASALATNVVLRSLFGAVFPLFATQMFTKLNPRWASTLLGFVALIMMPIPYLFVRYGPYLRSKSKYAPNKRGI